MDWLQIGKLIWDKLTGRKPVVVDQVQKWQDVYLKHVEFIKSDYEERIKYIQEEKKKHPENGVELLRHRETLDFYYNMTIKLNDENRDLKEELIFLKKEFELYKKKHG
jgi:hypothetical protein